LNCLLVGLYVDDIPMKLMDKYKPLDFSDYIEDQTIIPDLISEDVSRLPFNETFVFFKLNLFKLIK
jgi:hypothetical protein